MLLVILLHHMVLNVILEHSAILPCMYIRAKQLYFCIGKPIIESTAAILVESFVISSCWDLVCVA